MKVATTTIMQILLTNLRTAWLLSLEDMVAPHRVPIVSGLLYPQQPLAARHPGQEGLYEGPLAAVPGSYTARLSLAPGVDDHGIHGGEVLAVVCLAVAAVWALVGVGVAETPLAALKVVQLRARAGAGVGAGADVSGTVGRVAEAVLLAPDVHGIAVGLVGSRSYADGGPDDEGSHAVLGGGVPDHDGPGVVRGGQVGGGGDDPHVRAVPEGLLRSAAQARRAVITATPGVCRGPRPLQHTPRQYRLEAGQQSAHCGETTNDETNLKTLCASQTS